MVKYISHEELMNNKAFRRAMDPSLMNRVTDIEHSLVKDAIPREAIIEIVIDGKKITP